MKNSNTNSPLTRAINPLTHELHPKKKRGEGGADYNAHLESVILTTKHSSQFIYNPLKYAEIGLKSIVGELSIVWHL